MTPEEIESHPMVLALQKLMKMPTTSRAECARFEKRLAKLRKELVNEKPTSIKLLLKGRQPAHHW